MDIYSIRAKRLFDAIEKSGLSYVELEKKTGVSKSSIQRYASGKTKKIPIEALEKIAHAIGTDTKYLMGWEDIAPYKAGHEELPDPNEAYKMGGRIAATIDASLTDIFEEIKKEPPESVSEGRQKLVEALIDRIDELSENDIEDLATFCGYLRYRRSLPKG